MNATLYLPQHPPQAVVAEWLGVPTCFEQVPEQVATLLGCASALVDVLASGPGYVAYSVFDSEGEVNPTAMATVAAVSGVAFDAEDEDAVLRGAVLVVQA